MIFALLNGVRTTASPYAHTRDHAECPQCRAEVIAKCGPINAWHWAHRAADCDSWAEPDTQWHVDWQEMFPADCCEVPIGDHRADVRSPFGLVIEFQHSALSVDEIGERERHYGEMLWVFDAIEAYQTDRLNLRRKYKPGVNWWNDTDYPVNERYEPGNYRSFRWKHPRRSVLACQCPVYLDLGGGQLLEFKKMYLNAPYGGWGYLITTETFLQRCGLEFSFGGVA
jgi:competence protein CoiA